MDIKVNQLTLQTNPQITDCTITDTGNVTTERTTWESIFNLFVASGMDVVSSIAGLISTGTNQGNALVLTKTNNRVDTVAPGTGVVEPVPAVANTIKRTVQNRCGTGQDLLYYPYSGDHFFGLGANLPLTIADGNQVTVICYTTGELTTI